MTIWSRDTLQAEQRVVSKMGYVAQVTTIQSLINSNLAQHDAYDEQVKMTAAASQEIARLKRENDQLKAEGVPGRMHEVDAAFYKETVRQRDAAWAEIERLKAAR